MTQVSVLDRPLVIISTPRAGSTLLYETLATSPQLWSVRGESHAIIEGIPELSVEAHHYDSHRLVPAEATDTVIARLHARFVDHLVDHHSEPYLAQPPAERPQTVRFLEKTPRNVLRVGFLARAFPDARFVLLHRDPRATIASMIEAWLAPGFWQFRGDLPGWDRDEWCMLLPPGWRSLRGKSIAEICAYQWNESYRHALDDLSRIASSQWTSLTYEQLVADPSAALRVICEFADLDLDAELDRATAGGLRKSSSVVTDPAVEKWRRYEADIEAAWPRISEMAARLARLGS